MWRGRRCRRSSFPEIATTSLSEWVVGREFPLDRIIDYTLTAASLPRQHLLHSNFGNPPLTLYWSEDFFIDLLFWVDPRSDIHDHTFGGAFCVLRGRVLHDVVDFDCAESVPGKLKFGALRRRRIELLVPGDVRMIPYGSGLTHGTWHLSEPTLTLVIRTRHDPYDQHRYFKTMAVVQEAQNRETLLNPLVVKRLAILRSLQKIDSRQAAVYARSLVKEPDLLTAYLYLEAYYACSFDLELRLATAKEFRRKHGLRAGHLIAAAEEYALVRTIPWEIARDESSRLLLAASRCLDNKMDVKDFLLRSNIHCRVRETGRRLATALASESNGSRAWAQRVEDVFDLR